MILSDREIAAAIERGAIHLLPSPSPAAWSSTAVDLTLSADIQRWKGATGVPLLVTPHQASFDYKQFAQVHTETFAMGPEGFDLSPLQFVLGWTQEVVGLPQRSKVAARVEGKSSLARLGLGIHVTAPTIHAGFGYSEKEPDRPGRRLQLEIFNVGPHIIRLETGMRICQLIFEEVHGTPQRGYAGMFAEQGPQQV
jgi:dCTP deaminase